MSWQEVLEVIEPLVSERGYLLAKSFVMSRRECGEGTWFFKKIVQTKFKVGSSATGEGIVISPTHDEMDFIIVY